MSGMSSHRHGIGSLLLISSKIVRIGIERVMYPMYDVVWVDRMIGTCCMLSMSCIVVHMCSIVRHYHHRSIPSRIDIGYCHLCCQPPYVWWHYTMYTHCSYCRYCMNTGIAGSSAMCYSENTGQNIHSIW